MLRTLKCWVIVVFSMLMLTCANAQQVSGAEGLSYDNLAKNLATRIKPGQVKVGIGNFLYGDSKLMSAYSSLLRQELKTALCKTGRFQVISRERLSDLINENQFQGNDILDPGKKLDQRQIGEISGIVRGRFYYKYPNVTICAELVKLDGTVLGSAKTVISVKEVTAKIWPEKIVDNQVAGEAIQPRNLAKSAANLLDIEKRIADIPHDFMINIVTADSKHDYAEGEFIKFKVRSEKDCHIAVFCHQIDGSTSLLFPNRWCNDTKIRAGQTVNIPGNKKSEFDLKIVPPFGTDVVQVIACTNRSNLHRKLRDVVKRLPPGTNFCGVTRGMIAQAAQPNDNAQWSEAHIPVSTYPKF